MNSLLIFLLDPNKREKEGVLNSSTIECPMALLLFLLAVNDLIGCSNGLLKGFQMPSYPEGFPLLQYTDDTTFFMEISVEEAINLSILLDLFVEFSSLQINQAKFYFLGFRILQEEMAPCSYP